MENSLEDNELETNEQLADDDQPSERRSGGTADYVKGTINIEIMRGLRVFSSIQINLTIGKNVIHAIHPVQPRAIIIIMN